jgi:hypothetical protein
LQVLDALGKISKIRSTIIKIDGLDKIPPVPPIPPIPPKVEIDIHVQHSILKETIFYGGLMLAGLFRIQSVHEKQTSKAKYNFMML